MRVIGIDYLGNGLYGVLEEDMLITHGTDVLTLIWHVRSVIGQYPDATWTISEVAMLAAELEGVAEQEAEDLAEQEAENPEGGHDT